MTVWSPLLIVTMLATQAAQAGCGANRSDVGPPALDVGQSISTVISARIRPCTNTTEPCRTFRVSPKAFGMLSVSIARKDGAGDLRLEAWNGLNGTARCCGPIESVSLRVSPGDQVDIRVILVAGNRASFELNTSLDQNSATPGGT